MTEADFRLSREDLVQQLMFARCALYTVRETMMANPDTDDRLTNAVWGIEESLERLEDRVMVRTETSEEGQA